MNTTSFEFLKNLQTPDYMDAEEFDAFADNITTAMIGFSHKKIDLEYQVKTLTNYLNGHYKEYIVQGSCETTIKEINNLIAVLCVLREDVNDILLKMDEKATSIDD